MEMERRIGGGILMGKEYARPLVPIEFQRWINERQRALEKMARTGGRKAPVTQMDAMRVISQTGSVDIPEEVFRKLVGKLKC